LWYYVTFPPIENEVPPANLAEHITGNQELPLGIAAAQAPKDPNATASPQVKPKPPVQGII
jgi:hypothetical protein